MPGELAPRTNQPDPGRIPNLVVPGGRRWKAARSNFSRFKATRTRAEWGEANLLFLVQIIIFIILAILNLIQFLMIAILCLVWCNYLWLDYKRKKIFLFNLIFFKQIFINFLVELASWKLEKNTIMISPVGWGVGFADCSWTNESRGPGEK